MVRIDKLQTFLREQLPHVRCATPTSPEYAELREAFMLDSPTVPLAIVRPHNAEDVAPLVRFAVTNDIGLTVRTGGHDLYGRCFAQDCLTIDMRDVSFVEIDQDKLSATIGGGTLAGEVAEALTEQKLATAFGTVSSVGYVGWAIHGGYGPFIANYGLGVDQILGAKVVNYEGDIIQADAEMLSVIRGGGGTLGVIVEMKIKVYPLESIFAGMLVFDSTDMASIVKNFAAGCKEMTKRGLPAALGLQPSIVNTPMGKCYAVGFMWSSDDLDQGRKYLDEISSLGHVVHGGVGVTTIPEWLKANEAFIPKSAYGGVCTINLRELTDEVNDVVGREVAKMPDDPATLTSIHQLRGASSDVNNDSVYGARTPHYLFEFCATSSDPERAKAAWDWAVGFRDALRNTDPNNILTSTYICLTPPWEASSEVMYGDKWGTLVRIKKSFDPDNVFKHALPKFPPA